MPRVGQRLPVRRQQLPRGDAQRQLAAARADRLALDADHVPQRDAGDAPEDLIRQHVDRRQQLQAPGTILDVEEDELALTAPGHDATGEAVARAGLGARLELLVGGADVGDRGASREPVRERVVPHARYAALMETIFTLIGPPGVTTSTVSPFLWPRIARPIGDSLESRSSSGSDSAEPTSW